MQAPHNEVSRINEPNPGPTLSVLSAMADALPWPLLVLRAGGWLVFANRAGHQLLDDGRVVSLIQGRRLLLTPARQQDKLNDAIASAATSGERSLMQLPGPGCGYTASITRLSAATADQPAHVLMALAGDDSRVGDTRQFATLHRLSPAETRVLLCLARGISSTRVAEALGVTSSTVRSQILSLRRKTGHASVAHLLRDLNRMPPIGAASQAEHDTTPKGG